MPAVEHVSRRPWRLWTILKQRVYRGREPVSFAMYDDTVTNCPRCVNPIVREDFDGTERGVERYRCSSCGYLQWVEALQAPSPGTAPPRPPKTVIVRWHGRSRSSRELVAIRTLVPALRDRPIADVCKLVAGPDYVIGTFEPWEADEIAAQGRELGLQVVLV